MVPCQREYLHYTCHNSDRTGLFSCDKNRCFILNMTGILQMWAYLFFNEKTGLLQGFIRCFCYQGSA